MDGVVMDCRLDDLAKDGVVDPSLVEEESKEDDSYVAKERIMKSVYIPPEEMEKLRESYSHSIVQDFDDNYHLTREEREQQQELFGKFIALKKRRKKIRKIDQYVETHRLCMDILNDVAESNGVYSPERFKKLVLSGKITVNGLVFPKLQGKARKQMNWDYITENYIEDTTKDPKELLREDESEDFSDEETIDDAVVRYFGSQEEFDKIIEDFDEERKIYNSRPILDTNDDEYVAEVGTKKTRKALVKSSPIILDEIKKRSNLDRKNRRARSYITDLQDEDMEFITKYDLKMSSKSNKGTIPVFTGDITNKDDVNRYMTQMEEYERENTFVDYHGKRINLNDLNEINLKAAMEANGWNLRNLYSNKKEQKKLEKARKEDKKKEKRLKKMLMEIQQRKQGRKESIEGIKINSKKKKSGMKKKKKKNVKKKHKKELNYLDDVFLDINNRTEETFNEYRKEMESFSWNR